MWDICETTKEMSSVNETTQAAFPNGPQLGPAGAHMECCLGSPETLYHRDDALLYMAYVILIWAAPIPADRWHCSLWP